MVIAGNREKELDKFDKSKLKNKWARPDLREQIRNAEKDSAHLFSSIHHANLKMSTPARRFQMQRFTLEEEVFQVVEEVMKIISYEGRDTLEDSTRYTMSRLALHDKPT